MVSAGTRLATASINRSVGLMLQESNVFIVKLRAEEETITPEPGRIRRIVRMRSSKGDMSNIGPFALYHSSYRDIPIIRNSDAVDTH